MRSSLLGPHREARPCLLLPAYSRETRRPHPAATSTMTNAGGKTSPWPADSPAHQLAVCDPSCFLQLHSWEIHPRMKELAYVNSRVPGITACPAEPTLLEAFHCLLGVSQGWKKCSARHTKGRGWPSHTHNSPGGTQVPRGPVPCHSACTLTLLRPALASCIWTSASHYGLDDMLGKAKRGLATAALQMDESSLGFNQSSKTKVLSSSSHTDSSMCFEIGKQSRHPDAEGPAPKAASQPAKGSQKTVICCSAKCPWEGQQERWCVRAPESHSLKP